MSAQPNEQNQPPRSRRRGKYVRPAKPPANSPPEPPAIAGPVPAILPVSATIPTYDVASFPWDAMAVRRAVEMTITPALAAEILARCNKDNRPNSARTGARYATALREGRWQFNGEPLIFGWDGRLLDGQRRLTGCVASGIPLTTFVIFGIDPAAFESIDGGDRRSNADRLGSGEVYRNLISAIGVLVYHLKHNGGAGYGRHVEDYLAMAEIMADFEWTRSVAAYAHNHPAAKSCAGRKPILRASIIGGLYYKFSQLDEDAALKFFDDLASGANMAANDPVHQLRDRLMADRASISKLPVHRILALTIKAWSYRRRGKTVAQLRWNDRGEKEAFPAIV